MGYEQERALARTAAKEAGLAIRKIYDTMAFTSVEKADGKGPLTEADLAANVILIRHIQASFPGDAILSEETKDTPARLSNRRCWIIDPLDGTKEFTEHVPEFCVSVGFVVDGVAVVGALYNPVTEVMVDAEVGVGCTKNGVAVHVTPKASLDGAKLLVSNSEHKKGWFKAIEGQAELLPVGSVAWKAALVACGEADATFTPKPRNEWDLCGGVACVVAAGGRCTSGTGKDYDFNRADPLHIGVYLSNGALHGAIYELGQSIG